MKTLDTNRPNRSEKPHSPLAGATQAIPRRCILQRLPLALLWILACFSLILLTGCGSEAGQTNHGYGYHFDESGATGLRVRYDGHTAPTLAQLEALYTETQTCMGVTATGPLVIYVESLAQSVRGTTYLDTGTVIIRSAVNTHHETMVEVHKHEFIHHLLHRAGFDQARNIAHDSPIFSLCTQPSA